ncbi:hypothetical protein KQH90_02275 [Anaerosalibacter bizertensis]|uniref:LolA family protein n=2 Tax=Anaerosalibacter bizertensis TaxID=932217 RepID=UPI001C0E9440|nr:outer-membrane lipoprotein carrier protein LolA [Anaerosalibacter bizertensis]MBU5292864.1 hypothetical protein [Anaerosalibacter bizertensis]
MRKVLSVLFLIIVLLMFTSCKKTTDEEILNNIKKNIDDFDNYESISTVVVKSNKGVTSYKFKEVFIKPDKIKLEIIEPKESLGCIIIYDGDKIFLKHPNISQTISMENIKSLDKSFFIGNFYEKLGHCENPQISIEEEYIIFTMDLQNQSDYRYSQKVWLNKKDFVPYKLNILDRNGEVNTEIFYENFKYNLTLDEDF